MSYVFYANTQVQLTSSIIFRWSELYILCKQIVPQFPFFFFLFFSHMHFQLQLMQHGVLPCIRETCDTKGLNESKILPKKKNGIENSQVKIKISRTHQFFMDKGPMNI